MSEGAVMDAGMNMPLAENVDLIDAHVRHIIQDAMLNIIWTGAIPVPGLDGLFVGVVQATMIDRICTLHGKPVSRHRRLMIVASASGGVLATATHITARSLKFFPGLGMFAGAPLVIATSAASTYAIGMLVDRHLRTEGDVDSLSIRHQRARFKQFYREGLSLARSKDKGGVGG